MPKILVTGGAGYIGSHVCVELLNAGYEVVVYDNLSNSSHKVIELIHQITGKTIEFIRGDVLWQNDMHLALRGVDAVIHLAGVKSVNESVENPLKYYDNNVQGTLNLLFAMRYRRIDKILFSSSATVYGVPESLPLTEDCFLSPTNPYGRSKLMAEQMIDDQMKTGVLAGGILRYFNPVGAHESGLIGEDPRGIPANLLPYVAQVASGRLPIVKIFGDDYNTPDGTGVRDYIHVVDLAKGHVAALNFLFKDESGFTINLGTGRGYSVLEMIRAFEKAAGKTIPTILCDRRPGDVAECYADPSMAEQIIGWKAEKTLQDMVNDHWRWTWMNPKGYES